MKQEKRTPTAIYDLREDNTPIVEGTGSLIFDKASNIAYASLSERTTQAKAILTYFLLTFSNYLMLTEVV